MERWKRKTEEEEGVRGGEGKVETGEERGERIRLVF